MQVESALGRRGVAQVVDELDLRALSGALWRKKRLIIALTLAAAAVAFVAVNMVTSRYRSEARVLIETRDNIFVRPEAEKTGVILGLENTNSAEDNARILDRAQSKAVLVYYDVGNSFNNGFDIYKEIGWLGKDRICEFHLKDNPKLIGQGKIDFPKVIGAIVETGFNGWAQLETVAPSGDVSKDMKANLDFVRGLLAKA